MMGIDVKRRLEQVAGFFAGGGILVFAVDAMWSGADVLLMLSETLFPLLSVVSRFLAEDFAVFDQWWIHRLFLFFALVYVINLILKTIERTRGSDQ